MFPIDKFGYGNYYRISYSDGNNNMFSSIIVDRDYKTVRLEIINNLHGVYICIIK